MMKKYFVTIVAITLFSVYSICQGVGIGITNPSDVLHIVGATNDDPLRVQVGTATKLRVLKNGGTTIGANNTSGTPTDGLYVQGNTGLGVGSPTDKLAVGGDVNITGEIKANGMSGTEGQVLQSNGNGTMSWANPCGYKNFRDFFNPANNPQFWKVPPGVTEIMVEMWGAGGGGSTNYGGGGGAYIKFVRAVTPGDTIFFTLGEGGKGINFVSAAESGTATTFPSSNGVLNNSAGGGSSGSTGLGGVVSITNSPINSSIRLRGSHGKPRDISFYPISSSSFAEKTIYGDGGLSGYNSVLSGHGGIVCDNTTNGLTIIIQSGRAGSQPGGGGGGGNNHISGLSSGGAGGDGYVVIYWN